jgi:hypothetical protein
VTTNEFERLERDLEAAFAVETPELAFEVPISERPATHRRFAWRTGAVTGIAAAAILGAVLVAPSFGGDGPKVASAEELIQRSIAATAALGESPENYHMVTVARSSGAENATETWSGGQNRYRTESRSTVDGAGTLVEGTAMVGGEMWVYQSNGDELRVAHGPALFDVRPRPLTFTLDQHMASWTADGCFDAQVTGRELVAGREAHVISVTATPEDCPYQPKPLKRATIWVAVDDNVALKTAYEGDGEDYSSSFEVTRFETFDSLPDSVFAYVAPAGTEVLEFEDETGLKQALSTPLLVPRGSAVTLGDGVVLPGEE